MESQIIRLTNGMVCRVVRVISKDTTPPTYRFHISIWISVTDTTGYFTLTSDCQSEKSVEATLSVYARDEVPETSYTGKIDKHQK